MVMVAQSPSDSPHLSAVAARVGELVRSRRKVLGVTAVAAAEAAGMSRVTWHRIERGELSVNFGAYLSALDVLGLSVTIASDDAADATTPVAVEGWLPLQIRLSDFPQLRGLAWQVHGVEVLTPREAWSFYQRNWRYVDTSTLEQMEQQLIAGLEQVFGKVGDGV